MNNIKNLPSSDPVTVEEVARFIQRSSDFGFEVKVANEFRKLGCIVNHAHSYVDPTTGTTREFDLRVFKSEDVKQLTLSVECKNISLQHPIVISCSPREPNESYHFVFEGRAFGNAATKIARSRIYREKEITGRAIEQFSRNENKVTPRSDYYSKFAQSLQSATANIADARQNLTPQGSGGKALIIPCLVIPNDLLWYAVYDENGIINGDPKKINHISVTVALNKTFQSNPAEPIYHYGFSHLEIMTFEGIQSFWNGHLRIQNDFNRLFELLPGKS